MSPDPQLPEPWRSFLADIHRSTSVPLALTCIGGFAVTHFYGLARPTGDIDVIDVTPADAKPWLVEVAGEGSRLNRRHKVYVQVVTVALLPYPRRAPPVYL